MRAWYVGRGAWGVTLIELIVVLAILGVILGVSGLALGTLKAPRESELALALRSARTQAIRTGIPRTTHHARFLADGRAIGPGVDPLTGAPLAK